MKKEKKQEKFIKEELEKNCLSFKIEDYQQPKHSDSDNFQEEEEEDVLIKVNPEFIHCCCNEEAKSWENVDAFFPEPKSRVVHGWLATDYSTFSENAPLQQDVSREFNTEGFHIGVFGDGAFISCQYAYLLWSVEQELQKESFDCYGWEESLYVHEGHFEEGEIILEDYLSKKLLKELEKAQISLNYYDSSKEEGCKIFRLGEIS